MTYLRSLTASIGLLALASTSANADTVIRFSNWVPPTAVVSAQILTPWAEAIEKETEGRVRIELLPALGKPAAHFDLVRDGVADAAFVNPSYTTDRFGSGYGVTFPGLAKGAEGASVAYWRTYKEHFESWNEYEGTYLIGAWTIGPNHVFTSASKPIATAADLNGVRLRATGGVVQDVSRLLGIVPQFAAVTEVYELLSTGVVDGVFFNWDSIGSFKLTDMLKNVYEVPGGMFRDTHNIVFNKAVYDKLSEADRAAIEKHSGEALAKMAGQVWDRLDAKGREDLAAAGYTIVTASEADAAKIKEIGLQLEADWVEKMKAAGHDGAAALETFKRHVAEVEAAQ
jgi:TRAP-type C4-dicarboxylate transport system substrate-binding protein